MTKYEEIFLIIMASIYLPILLIEFIFYLKLIKRPNLNFKKYLKINIIIFLFLGLSFLILSYKNFLDYEKPIPFKEFERIDFKNFRGLELIKKKLYGSKYFAYVVTSIEYEIDQDHVKIESYFHPSSSFVYNKNSNSKDLLTHELYHFRITELFTRKAKEEIHKRANLKKDDIKKIIDSIKLEEREYQIKYDYDTYHSYVYEKQISYQKEIDSLLISLKKFKKSKIKYNEK